MPENRIARGERPDAPPLVLEARELANMMFNDAMALVDILAPEGPVDTEPLTDWEMYKVLEQVAVELPVTYWDDAPEALRDLSRLRKQFQGRDSEYLDALAKRFESIKKKEPDISIAPGGPEWEAQEKRMSS